MRRWLFWVGADPEHVTLPGDRRQPSPVAVFTASEDDSSVQGLRNKYSPGYIPTDYFARTAQNESCGIRGIKTRSKNRAPSRNRHSPGHTPAMRLFHLRQPECR